MKPVVMEVQQLFKEWKNNKLWVKFKQIIILSFDLIQHILLFYDLGQPQKVLERSVIFTDNIVLNLKDFRN